MLLLYDEVLHLREEVLHRCYREFRHGQAEECRLHCSKARRFRPQTPDPYRGFRVGAFAMTPYALLWILFVLAKFGVLPEGYSQVYRLANMPFMPYINWVTYNGDLQKTTIWQILLLLPMLLYIPAVCGVAYRLGHKQFSIREHLLFAKKEQTPIGEKTPIREKTPIH